MANMITLRHLFITFLISTGVTIFGMHWFIQYYSNHIPFNTYINDISVENLTSEEAHALLAQSVPPLEERTITLTAGDTSIASSSSELEESYDVSTAVNTALAQYKNRSIIGKLRHLTERLHNRQEITIKKTINPDKTAEFISELSRVVDVKGEEPSAKLSASGNVNTLTIFPGKYGSEIDVKATQDDLLENIRENIATTPATVASTSTVLSDITLEVAKARATKFVGFSQILEHDTTRVTFTDVELLSLLTLPEGVSEEKIDALIETWNKRVERKPQNAKFEYNKETLAVSLFEPPREGLALRKKDVKEYITSTIKNIDDTIDPTKIAKNPEPMQLPVEVTEPSVTLAKSNDLGIKERVGVGESTYKGSIPSRIHNVSLAASRIANYIVKPGQEFSFNDAIGDVSAATGYQSAYVIMNGQTVLGDGGGVCQVSTTLFRALLNGGVEITRRLPHSYRVGYYEQNTAPGIDATVFSGNVDLRFKNDTPGHLLIHTQVDSKSQYMIVELYGTSDGRTASISEIKQWDARPAPPAQYIPDPSLGPGQLKQIDWAVGGLKTSFRHVVKDKNGNVTTDKVYTSNYRPWAAKYLQGV